MLQTLREHAQGWIAGVIVGILCLAFALWGIEYYLTGSHKAPAVVKVNGVSITQENFDSVYKRLRQQSALSDTSLSFNEAQQKALKAEALDKLVLQYVMSQAAEKEGYTISAGQIGSMLTQIPIFQQNGVFSPELFQQTISSFYPSEQAFIEDLKRTSLVIQAKIGIVSTNFALPNELNRALMLQNQTRSFSYLLIPTALFLKKSTITQEAIDNYYKNHQANFMQPEELKLAYIELSPKALDPQITVTEQEIAQYYEENKPAFLKSLSAVHDQIKNTLHQLKLEQLLANASDQLSNLTYTNPDSLKPAADALKLPIQTTDFFTRQGSKQGMAANPKVLAVAFSDNVLKQRNNSDLVSLDNQTALVFRVTDYKPAVVKPLSEVQPTIVSELSAASAKESTQALGKKIIDEVTQGASLAQVSKENKLQWNQKANIERQAQRLPPEVLKLAFELRQKNPNQASLGGVYLPDGSYAIVALTKVQYTQPTAAAMQQSKNLSEMLAAEFGAFDYDLYQAEAMRRAKVKKYIQ